MTVYAASSPQKSPAHAPGAETPALLKMPLELLDQFLTPRQARSLCQTTRKDLVERKGLVSDARLGTFSPMKSNQHRLLVALEALPQRGVTAASLQPVLPHLSQQERDAAVATATEHPVFLAAPPVAVAGNAHWLCLSLQKGKLHLGHVGASAVRASLVEPALAYAAKHWGDALLPSAPANATMMELIDPRAQRDHWGKLTLGFAEAADVDDTTRRVSELLPPSQATAWHHKLGVAHLRNTELMHATTSRPLALELAAFRHSPQHGCAGCGDEMGILSCPNCQLSLSKPLSVGGDLRLPTKLIELARLAGVAVPNRPESPPFPKAVRAALTERALPTTLSGF